MSIITITIAAINTRLIIKAILLPLRCSTLSSSIMVL
jgi:hypothetical protein